MDLGHATRLVGEGEGPEDLTVYQVWGPRRIPVFPTEGML